MSDTDYAEIAQDPAPGQPDQQDQQDSPQAPESVRWPVRALQIVFLLLFVFTSWRLAWISDDALITVRVALNANEGLGPVYNADERVQAFTHPLWFGVVWATGAVSGSWIYGLIYVSLAIATIAVAIMLWRTKDVFRLVFLGIALLLSNTILEWTSSGLEGPLAVLLVVLCWYMLRLDKIPQKPILTGLLSAALVLTRLDFLVAVVPLLVLITVSLRSQRRVLWQFWLAAAAPVLAYYIWSKIYYGFALPATYYAKTNTTIPKSEIIGRGLEYLQVSASFDQVAAIVIILATIFTILIGSTYGRAWMAGTWLYLIYVVWVGGDFMAGRFLLVPLVVSMLVVAGDVWKARKETMRFARILLGLGIAAMIGFGVWTSLFVHSSTYTVPFDPGAGQVYDERAYYADRGRALDPFVTRDLIREYMPFTLADNERFAEDWIKAPTMPTGKAIIVCGGLGNSGLWAGPSVHVIDSCGLADMYIAQIPFTPFGPWRIGHFERAIPPDYERAIKTGDPSYVVDPEMRSRLIQLWQKIR